MHPFIILLSIAGGVALVLFGVRYLRKGLDRIFGPRLGQYVARMTRNRFTSFLSGIGVAIMAPSSTTMSLLAVQTVQTTQTTARQMLAMLYGANIGLTITVLLISFRLERYAPLFFLAGAVLFLGFIRSTWRGIGQVLLSLGFIFTAIGIIKQFAGAVEAEGDMAQLIEIASHYPWLLAGCAALLAVGLQSSTATIGLIIGLVAANRLSSLSAAVAVVAGANVGITLTTLLAGWRQVESRRMALGIMASAVAVALLFLALLDPITGWIGLLPAQDAANRIAYAHTGFNLVMAVLGLPLVGVISRLATRLAPQPPSIDPRAPRYIGHPMAMDSPSLALGQSARELGRMAEIVRGMLADEWKALKTNDEALAIEAADRDDLVDALDQHIKAYLSRLAREALEHQDAERQIQQLRYLSDLEHVGDTIDKNISMLVRKKIAGRVAFSDAGAAELDDYYERVMANMVISETAALEADAKLARQLIGRKQQIDELETELRDRHFQRLTTGEPHTEQSSAIHLDLITYLRTINSHITHIAYTILGETDHVARGG
jgi:phosphate:Na+ symporter